MSEAETEMSDIVVVLVEEPGMSAQQAALMLAEQGMMVANVDEENYVIEGAVPTERIGLLEKLPFVKTVRDVFNYIVNDEKEEDVDDAGA